MRDRTADLLRAKQALSQLSYSPVACLFTFLLRCRFRSLNHILMYAHSIASNGALLKVKNPALRHNQNTFERFA